MTAPDPGLTDLLAAHEGGYDAMDDPICKCGWYGDSHATHVALVVEQHTNGRIAELAAENVRLTHGIQQISMERDGYQQAYENDNAATFGITGLIQRANIAEATVARVEAEATLLERMIRTAPWSRYAEVRKSHLRTLREALGSKS